MTYIMKIRSLLLISLFMIFSSCIKEKETNRNTSYNLINQRGVIKIFVCTRGCYQYLIETAIDSRNVYYYDKNLPTAFQKDNLAISFSGILQTDSTMIYVAAPNDGSIPDFKARNILLYELR